LFVKLDNYQESVHDARSTKREETQISFHLIKMMLSRVI